MPKAPVTNTWNDRRERRLKRQGNTLTWCVQLDLTVSEEVRHLPGLTGRAGGVGPHSRGLEKYKTAAGRAYRKMTDETRTG